MRVVICLGVLVLALALVAQAEEQRILRRVIKSTPTATNLGRVRAVTIRSPSEPEKGAVAEISSKDAANFGQRSANETSSQVASIQSSSSSPLKSTTSRPSSTTQTSPQSPSSSTQSSSSAASTTSQASTTTASALPSKTATEAPKAGDRQQSGSPSEVELLSSAPSSWQTMTAVEAPAAMLIASGVRASSSSASSHDLSSSSSTLHSSEESAASTGDFLRSSATKGSATTYAQEDSTSGETFSRVQQQQQQQSFFYPQSARTASKTASVKGTKTHWYQPPAPSTTPRPAPLVQEQFEQYVEQTPQIEYGSAPLGQAEPFAFDFKTQDQSGNGQYRKEESDKNGVVRGSYGYTDANGIYRHVEYVADQNGFRANIKSNEPGLNGDTQPASIQLNGGGSAAPAAGGPQRLSSASSENTDWISNINNNQDSGADSANLALAPPNFESAHRSDRIRAPRHYRN